MDPIIGALLGTAMSEQKGNRISNFQSGMDQPSAEVMANYFGMGSPEALAAIIKKQENVDPKHNNPGALMKNVGNDIYELRKFDTYEEGMSALLNDLIYKAKGNSSVMGPDASIEEFVNMYVAGGKPGKYERKYPGELGAYMKAIDKGA